MKLRILTLNVWALTPPLSRHTAERMRAIGAVLAELDLDLVALQELWDADARSLLLEATRGSGLPHHAIFGGGLAVLSRHPIRKQRMNHFLARGVAERIHEADWLGRKGFGEVVVELPTGPFAFVDTHLQAAYALRADDPHVATRVAQSLQLAARLRGVALPLALGGDFNAEEDHLEYRMLAGVSGLVDAAAALDARQDTIVATNAYSRGSQQGKRIDCLLYRSGAAQSVEPISIARVLDQPLDFDGEPASYSDHAGVLGEFVVTDGGGSLARPDPSVLREARERIEAARLEVERRQQAQRVKGSLALGALPAAVLLANRPAISRRRLLRGALIGAGGLVGLGGFARLVATERFRAEEARGFDRSLEILRTLGG